MRTIKFRGKNLKGQWHYGLLCHDKTKDSDYEWFISNSAGKPYAFGAIPETIGQFTWLHDKNGKEIYTGDILQLKKLDGIVLLYKIFCVKGGFAFNTHQDDFYKPQIEIYFYESTSDMQNSSFISTLEIIGNIFENQELLENKSAD